MSFEIQNFEVSLCKGWPNVDALAAAAIKGDCGGRPVLKASAVVRRLPGAKYVRAQHEPGTAFDIRCDSTNDKIVSLFEPMGPELPDSDRGRSFMIVEAARSGLKKACATCPHRKSPTE